MPVQGLNELIDQFGMETMYNKSILALDPKEKRWLEFFQKFFAIAVETPRIYQSGVLDATISSLVSSYPEDNNIINENNPLPRNTHNSSNGIGIDKKLENMYRMHRAAADERLYGVKLEEIVKEEN